MGERPKEFRIIDIFSGTIFLVWVVSASYGMSVPNGTFYLSAFDNISLPGIKFRLDCYLEDIVATHRLLLFAWFMSILFPVFLFLSIRNHDELYSWSIAQYKKRKGLEIFGKYRKPGWGVLIFLIIAMLIPVIKSILPTDILGHCSNHFRGINSPRELLLDGIWIIGAGLFSALGIIFMNGWRLTRNSGK